MMTGGEKRVPTLVRACRWYVVAIFVFAVVVPLLPKWVQEATHPMLRPVGVAMMLLLAFSMPIAVPDKELDPLRNRIGFAVFFTVVMALVWVSTAYSVAHPSAPSVPSAKSCP